MNSKIFLIISLLLIIPFISADRVGVVVNFPDSSTHVQCIETDENTNGYNLLNDGLSLSTLWTSHPSFGHSLCKVNQIGNDISLGSCFSSNFWRFLKVKNNKWESLPVGFDGGNICFDENTITDFNHPNFEIAHYCTEDEDVLGFDFVESTFPIPEALQTNVPTFDEICNTLTLNEVKVYVDDKKESDADEEGGDIEAEPGDEIKFKIELENTYKFDDEREIEDIEVEVTILDVDDGSDLDDDVSFKDLDVNDDDKETISLTLPLVLDDDDYEVELRVTANHPDGTPIDYTINYDLNIDKEKHDLKFSKLRLESEESCPSSLNQIDLEISNIGEKDENNVKLTIKNEDLNIDFKDRFDIDEGDPDDIYNREIEFRVPNLPPGDYNIDVNLAHSETTNKDLILTIKDCNQQAPITGDVISQPTNNQVTQATPNNQPYIQPTFIENYGIPIIIAIFLLFLTVAIIYIVSIL